MEADGTARMRKYEMPMVKKENYIPNYSQLVAYIVKQFAFDVLTPPTLFHHPLKVHFAQRLRGVLHARQNSQPEGSDKDVLCETIGEEQEG